MEWADYVILAVCVISIMVGALRGLIKEAFSLAVWIAAFLIAFQYSGVLADNFLTSVSLPSARSALAFAGLFIVVLVLGGLITYLLGKLVEKTGLSGTDRLLGGVFGAARGIIMVVSMMLIAGLTPIPEDPWWGQSRGIQSFMPLADWAATFLPESIAEHLDLHPEIEAKTADA